MRPAASVTPAASRRIVAHTRIVQPAVTTDSLAERYPWYIVVNRPAFTLTVYERLRPKKSYPVAVGTSSTPTPRGLYYIVELLKPSSPNGTYGPFSFGLSAHSNVLKRFAGGDGKVQIIDDRRSAIDREGDITEFDEPITGASRGSDHC